VVVIYHLPVSSAAEIVLGIRGKANISGTKVGSVEIK
jgi:hypothetical protein